MNNMANAKASTAATLAAITKISNIELWNAVRKYSPTFASHTAEGTADMFTERGFKELTSVDNKIINEFLQLSIRVALNQVNISHARDPLAEAGFGEAYEQPYGGITQRMAVQSIKPVTPAYKNLQDGDSVDPFIVRKPAIEERFWEQNFDYQSYITMQDFNIKQVFISEYGVSELVAGIMQGLLNGWIVQKYTNKLEVLNAGINDTALLPTQTIGVSYTDGWTDEQLRDFILQVRNVIAMMTVSAQSSAFNSKKFASVQDKGRLKLLVRAGFGNALAVKTLVGAYNPGELGLGVDVIEVEHFGGIKYTTSEGAALYPVYDKNGSEIGLAASATATPTYQKEDADVVAVDGNADVIAVLADKGWLFETMQNGYTVEAIHNPRGLYDNYWASSANNGIHYDRLYNFVVFKAAEEEPPEPVTPTN